MLKRCLNCGNHCLMLSAQVLCWYWPTTMMMMKCEQTLQHGTWDTSVWSADTLIDDCHLLETWSRFIHIDLSPPEKLSMMMKMMTVTQDSTIWTRTDWWDDEWLSLTRTLATVPHSSQHQSSYKKLFHHRNTSSAPGSCKNMQWPPSQQQVLKMWVLISYFSEHCHVTESFMFKICNHFSMRQRILSDCNIHHFSV